MRKVVICGLWVLLLCASSGLTYFQAPDPGEPMTKAGRNFVESLTAEQRASALLDAQTAQRLEWHFIPKDERKGVQIKHLSGPQRKAAHRLLQAALSDVGYSKATQIMELERLLAELEGSGRRWLRDAERYYFTLFGNPDDEGRWGLSVEGHHLSLNFTVQDGRVVSTTPQFFGANPALVKTENNSGIKVGTRVLDKEETLAFELVNSLSDQQRERAILAPEAPREIRDAGSPQPPTAAPEGIAYRDLTGPQRKLLMGLINEYCAAVPDPIATQRQSQIQFDGENDIHFAWAGPTKPGIGHYYRVQGPSFLIEFVNTQPDAAGNPANHIHCVWRNLAGDFAIPVAAN